MLPRPKVTAADDAGPGHLAAHGMGAPPRQLPAEAQANLVIAVGAAVVGSGAQAVVPLIERQIVDNVIVHHRSPLWPWLAALVALGAIGFGAAYLRRYREAGSPSTCSTT